MSKPEDDQNITNGHAKQPGLLGVFFFFFFKHQLLL